MTRISAYQLSTTAEALHAFSQGGEVPGGLLEPMQALVAVVSRRVAEAPLSIYVCADDDGARVRDDVALALARTLGAHVPSTLLVDCDFVHAGLHGAVPQKDALGFLDFLLYGSSIGVITQDAPGGIHVVGAGSFPVTKRMPFAESAFDEAARRLVAHARCALFVGPLFDEGGGVHALTREVDVVAVVRASARGAKAEAAEETIASGRAEVWSLRLGAAAPVAPSLPPAPVRDLAATQGIPRAASPAPRPQPARHAGPGAPSERASSLAPRIAIVVFGLLVIAFVVWWLLQNRSSTTQSSPAGNATTGTAAVPAAPVDSSAHAMSDSTRQSGTALRPMGADSVAVGSRPPVNPADTGGRSGGTVLINPADIHVMDEIARDYRGWFFIHISSFQTSIRARDEVAFLQSREFPVFIVFLDLGPKGKWYRVYAGPFETREEARDVKKNLDAVPQVRFTRIATIPE